VEQQAETLIPSFPNTRTVEFYSKRSASGYWGYPAFVQSALEDLGLVEIRINPVMWTHGADTPAECAKMMWQLVKLKTMIAFGGMGEQTRVEGWKLFGTITEILQAEFGDGPVRLSTVALVVTARLPE
jgi:hypothetical protein